MYGLCAISDIVWGTSPALDGQKVKRFVTARLSSSTYVNYMSWQSFLSSLSCSLCWSASLSAALCLSQCVAARHYASVDLVICLRKWCQCVVVTSLEFVFFVWVHKWLLVVNVFVNTWED
jgi:hypothetical protein